MYYAVSRYFYILPFLIEHTFVRHAFQQACPKLILNLHGLKAFVARAGSLLTYRQILMARKETVLGHTRSQYEVHWKKSCQPH